MKKHIQFGPFLRNLQEQHSTSVRDFAEKLGIDPSHLSRAMSEGGQPFDAARCLRLAALTGTDPALVLTLAGKRELADQIELLYGPVQAPLNAKQREMVTLMAQALDTDQEYVIDALLIVLRKAVATAPASKGKAGAGKKEGLHAVERRREGRSIRAASHQ